MKIIKVTQCLDLDGYVDCPYALCNNCGDGLCDHPEIEVGSLPCLFEGIPEGCPLEDQD
jgi:hypothetical protein